MATGVAAGASGALSLAKLWSRMFPRKQTVRDLLNGRRAYDEAQIRRLAERFEQVFGIVKDLDARVATLEERR